MVAVAENRNVQGALALMERDLRRAAVEYQLYGARRDRLEELQAAHSNFSAGLFPKPAALTSVRPARGGEVRRGRLVHRGVGLKGARHGPGALAVRGLRGGLML